MVDLTHLKLSIKEERIISSLPATRCRRELTLDTLGSVQMYKGLAILESAPFVGVNDVYLVSFVFNDGTPQHWNCFVSRKEADGAFDHLMDVHRA